MKKRNEERKAVSEHKMSESPLESSSPSESRESLDSISYDSEIPEEQWEAYGNSLCLPSTPTSQLASVDSEPEAGTSLLLRFEYTLSSASIVSCSNAYWDESPFYDGYVAMVGYNAVCMHELPS